MAKIACLFPGQGAQSVGMGRDFYEHFPAAQRFFASVDSIAGRKLSTLCFEGPEADLKRTINTQPTILAASLAAWECYRESGGPEPDFVAGHSLGEFSALYVSGVLSLESVVELVECRAKLMENCSAGAMSAVIGMPFETLSILCAEVSASDAAKPVVVANFNTREQLVVSGDPEAVKTLGEQCRAKGAKVIPLPVGGAFHSPLMTEAADAFAAVVANSQFAGPRYAVVQNFTASAATSSQTVQAAVSAQMRNSVRWCESIEYMVAQGANCFVEIGPGKALTGMVRKIDRSLKTFNVEDSASLAQTLAEIRACVPV